MNEDRKAPKESHGTEYYEDEIELMDYLLVLWKWKYLILIGTLVCAVAAAVISLQMDKVYSIQTVLQPGRLKVTEDGKTIFISSAETIKAIIETGIFDNRILSKVKTANRDDLSKTLELSVEIPPNSDALDISYETSDVDLGLQILNNLNELLLEKYGKLIRYYQEDYDIKVRLKSNEESKLTEKMAKVRNAISIIEAESKTAISEIEANISSKKAEISSSEAEKETKISEIEAKISSKKAEISSSEAEKETKISEIEAKISSKKAEIATKEAKKVVAIDQKDNSISTLKAQIAAKKKQIKNLLDRISDVKIEIGRISKNTDLLIEERNKFLSSTKDKDNILASVMYTNTIQQNIGYLNTLRSTVNSVNHQLFQESASIENLQNNIKDIYAQKNSIENQTKYNIENLKSEIKDQRVQIVGFGKQTKYNIENLRSEIKDQRVQIEGFRKQTKYNIENLRSDIKDLRTQNVSLKEQTKYKVENLKEEIKALKSEKEYILQEVKDLEFKKSFVQNIQILQPPKSSPYPIRPKTTLYIILSLVAGLFLMLFLSFFLEYLSKHKWTQER